VAPPARATATVPSLLPPSTTMTSSTQSRGIAREDRADCPLLIENRDDRGNPRQMRLVHRLQRTPHEAQAGGGVSLNSARRNSW